MKVKKSKKNELHDPEDEGTMVLWNIFNYLPADTV
jgi:hypothetical protein